MLSAIQAPQTAKYTSRIFATFRHVTQRRRLSAAIQHAYNQLSERYPEWTDSLFDKWFLSHRAAPLLADSTPPTAIELAVAWDQQLGGSAKRRADRIAKIMPVVSEFLHLLEEALAIES